MPRAACGPDACCECVYFDHHFAGDQDVLHAYAQGEFEAAERELHEVPPYQNDPFIQQVKDIATFDNARAALPSPASTTVAAQEVNVDWAEGEHPRLSNLHNQVERCHARTVLVMSGREMLFSHHLRNLLCCSPQMHTATHT